MGREHHAVGRAGANVLRWGEDTSKEVHKGHKERRGAESDIRQGLDGRGPCKCGQECRLHLRYQWKLLEGCKQGGLLYIVSF